MRTKVVPVRAGVATVYLIFQEDRFFLVDAGGKSSAKYVLKAISSRGKSVKDLSFIFLTHTHYDHAGAACELKKQKGASIIVNEAEAGFLRKGDHFIPSGTNTFSRIVSFLGRQLGTSYSGYQAVEPDITFTNDFSCEQFGFNARMILTPGHTVGSSSLIIGNKAFIGDTVFNFYGKIFPPFANDTTLLMQSWKLLLSEKIDWFFPAHGKPITRDVLLDEAVRRRIIET